MRDWVSFQTRLSSDLDDVEEKLGALLDASAIRNIDPNRSLSGSGVAYLGYARWGWVPATDEVTLLQIGLTRAFGIWVQRFETLLSGVPPQVAKR